VAFSAIDKPPAHFSPKATFYPKIPATPKLLASQVPQLNQLCLEYWQGTDKKSTLAAEKTVKPLAIATLALVQLSLGEGQTA
jgi:hypothetical protein